jgi:N-acetylglucosaminyl-diphospho-decaprenol L-rhamnosyltransferase
MSPTTRHVAVIIVTYKTAELTIACLESLLLELETPGIDLRAVVVDNASGDSPAIAQAIVSRAWQSWVTLVTAPRNGGFAYGNNLGFAEASRTRQPDYFHLLNPDTRIKPGAVRTLLEFLENHVGVGIAGSSFENGDGTDWPIAFRFPSLLSEIDGGLRLGVVSRMLYHWRVARVMSRSMQPVDWGAGASMMIRRDVLEAVGGLDENYFLYFEETEFCGRAKRAGYPMWYVPQSRVIHIAGQSTKVTERDAGAKRLPAYWFESRRRYFRTTAGLLQAILIDMAAIMATALGSLRLILQGRRSDLVPHYLSDLWRHSVIRPRNRRHPAPRVDWRTR